MTPEEQKVAEDAAKAAEEAKKAADEAAKLSPEEQIAKAREEAKKESDLAWQRKFDQKNTELQKKIAEAEALKKERMTEEEKKKFEMEEKERVLSEKEAALTAKEIENAKLIQMGEKSLPIEFKDYVTGSSVDEVSKKIDSLKVLFESAVSKEVETRMKSAGAAPLNSGGNTGGSNLQAQMKIAIENKDVVSQIRIQGLIDAEKKKNK
jgi:hypothetical protein